MSKPRKISNSLPIQAPKVDVKLHNDTSLRAITKNKNEDDFELFPARKAREGKAEPKLRALASAFKPSLPSQEAVQSAKAAIHVPHVASVSAPVVAVAPVPAPALPVAKPLHMIVPRPAKALFAAPLEMLVFLPTDIDQHSTHRDTMIDEDGAVQQLIECLHLMAADVDTLLRLPFDIFWSHVLYDTSVLSFVESYLRHAHPISSTSVQSDIQSAQVALSHRVLLLCVRMACPCSLPANDCLPVAMTVDVSARTLSFSRSRRLTSGSLGFAWETKVDQQLKLGNAVQGFPPAQFADLLYDNWVFDVPQLFDICRLYGESNHSLVQRLLVSVLAHQPKYYEDVEAAVQASVKDLLEIFVAYHNVASASAHSGTLQVQSVIQFVHGMTSSMLTFARCLPTLELLGFLVQKQLIHNLCIAYHVTLPVLALCVGAKTCDDVPLLAQSRTNIAQLVVHVIRRRYACAVARNVGQSSGSSSQESLEDLSDLICSSLLDELASLLQAISTPSDLSKSCSPFVAKHVEQLTLARRIVSDSPLIEHLQTELQAQKSRQVGLVAIVDSILSQTGNTSAHSAGSTASNPIDQAVSALNESQKRVVRQLVDMFPEHNVHVLIAAAQHFAFNVDRCIAAVLDQRLPPSVLSATESAKPVPAAAPADPRFNDFLSRKGRVEKSAASNAKQSKSNALMIGDEEKQLLKLHAARAAAEYDDEYDDALDSFIPLDAGDDAGLDAPQRQASVGPRRPHDEDDPWLKSNPNHALPAPILPPSRPPKFGSQPPKSTFPHSQSSKGTVPRPAAGPAGSVAAAAASDSDSSSDSGAPSRPAHGPRPADPARTQRRKEQNKAYVGNHNRKAGAQRKMARTGFVPQ